MSAVVLDSLSYTLDETSVLQALRIRPGSAREAEARALIGAATAIAAPKAMYRMAFIDEKGPDYVVIEGQKLTSRILRVNLGDLQRVFAFVCTSGHEIFAWARAQQDILAQFYADMISEMVLHSAMESLHRRLTETYALGQTSMMNPGSLADWPMAEQRPLFDLLGDVQSAIGVTLTSSMLMVPTKSVSGILFPSEETFASCQLCPRNACPNRRAPYDPTLFARRFADTEIKDSASVLTP